MIASIKGAVDNATGTAALIELGRAFAKAPRLERSVVFLNVTAEEKGLLGSEYYASKPLYPPATTVGVINMDALDPHGPTHNFTISGSAKLGLLDDLISEAKKFGMVYSADPKPEAGHFFRSDHFSFAKRGVPAIFFGSGNDWVDGGLAAGKAAEDDYTTKRYHQPGDEWQADWTFTGMARDLQVLYVLGSDLANSSQWPDWSKDSEFHAARDKTAKLRATQIRGTSTQLLHDADSLVPLDQRAMRRRVEQLAVDYPHIAAWRLSDETSRALVVNNLSETVQTIDMTHAAAIASIHCVNVTLNQGTLQTPACGPAILR